MKVAEIPDAVPFPSVSRKVGLQFFSDDLLRVPGLTRRTGSSSYGV